MTDGRHGVEVYHETPWGCFLMGLVGHMGNFLDLEKLCGGFWLDGSLGDFRPVITIFKDICQQMSKIKLSHGVCV